jgi:hypothetical protein
MNIFKIFLLSLSLLSSFVLTSVANKKPNYFNVQQCHVDPKIKIKGQLEIIDENEKFMAENESKLFYADIYSPNIGDVETFIRKTIRVQAGKKFKIVGFRAQPDDMRERFPQWKAQFDENMLTLLENNLIYPDHSGWYDGDQEFVFIANNHGKTELSFSGLGTANFTVIVE